MNPQPRNNLLHAVEVNKCLRKLFLFVITATVQMDSQSALGERHQNVEKEGTHVCRNTFSEEIAARRGGRGEQGYNIFSLPARPEESYDESANAANSWPHLHNTHQASLSLRQPVNSRLRHAHIHTRARVTSIHCLGLYL